VSIELFINAIQESGHVVVDAGDPKSGASLEAAIRGRDESWRNELAHEAPPLSMPSAAWAAMRMYRACQFLVYRQIEPPVIERDLAEPCPEPSSPGICYSVDLSLRVLPELLSLARGLSDDDPLVLALLKLAHEWPLSSVGIANIGDIDIAAFIDDPCLRQLYVDRIIQRNDVSRLTDPRVSDVVREALGAYPELAPTIAKAVGL
jgi:hypothetical protein